MPFTLYQLFTSLLDVDLWKGLSPLLHGLIMYQITEQCRPINGHYSYHPLLHPLFMATGNYIVIKCLTIISMGLVFSAHSSRFLYFNSGYLPDAFIQSDLQRFMPSAHRVNHARRQPAHREQLEYGVLLRDTSTLS